MMNELSRPSAERWSEEDRKSPAEIEAEIERTRERMSEDIDAIGEKLSPRHIKQRARAAVHGAQEAVVEKVQEVGRRTREAGTGVMDFVRHNPLPAAMTGIGIYWLYSRRRQIRDQRFGFAEPGPEYPRGEGRDRWEPGQEAGEPGRIREAMETAGDKAREGAEDLKTRARELARDAGDKLGEARRQAGAGARRTGDALQRFFDDSPMIAAAGVAVLGAIIGASLPRTRREDELMGSRRDHLLSQAGEVAEHARETVRERMTEPAPPASWQGNPGDAGGAMDGA